MHTDTLRAEAQDGPASSAEKRLHADLLAGVRLELRRHAPFTAIGAACGVGIAIWLTQIRAPQSLSLALFQISHPLHVLLSAIATTNLYARRRQRGILFTLMVGYLGSIGIATLSDSAVPFLGEWLLRLPNRAAHVGCIESWWIVHPAALLGITLGTGLPRTRLPHAGHVLISTSASLFHLVMALGDSVSAPTLVAVGAFLFVAVWLPCCTSDIVFPMLFPDRAASRLEPRQHGDSRASGLEKRSHHLRTWQPPIRRGG